MKTTRPVLILVLLLSLLASPVTIRPVRSQTATTVGLDGVTPQGSAAERLREEERWQVVNYLRTLARP